MTEEQTRRVERDMRRSAKGEAVKVERIRTTLYAYGSELACLRIFAHYLGGGILSREGLHVGYSENMGTWFFSVETT